MDRIKKLVTINNFTFLISTLFFFYMIYYFLTGTGGPLKLATRLLPVCIILFALYTIQKGKIYPKLGDKLNKVIALIYIAVAAVVLIYWEFHFEAITIYRAGSYTSWDILMGALMFIMVMEISRKIHTLLFWVNVALIIYTLYGYLSPIDFFWHPGTTLTRLVTSSTLELATGVYGRYAQMALTLIAAFLLMASVARAFGAQEAIINCAYAIFGRSKQNIPQVAVFSSATIGAVTGSSSANVAVTGAFTIPLMVRHGFTPVYAGAVETSSSMGGLILPPLMAVAGFVMADFLGVPYWDVVIRAFSISFIYFTAVVLAVYLLSVRMIAPGKLKPPSVPMHDKLKTASFFASILLLILLLGVFGIGPMRSAVYASGLLFVLLGSIYVYYKYIKKDSTYVAESPVKIIRNIIETHADMTWYMVLLMSTMGIMIGLFTVTGFIIRMGALLMELGAVSIILTIFVAWVFGWIAGLGLPPTATYIVVAIIVVPPFVQWGFNPWIGHWFAFMLSVWGELSPPTSMTAAVAAKLAEAPFLKVMLEALKICAPILIMTFAIFTRQEVVTTPGWEQILATLITTAGTLAVTFATFGKFHAKQTLDIFFRTLLILLGGIALFHPDNTYALYTSIVVTLLLGIGIYKHKHVAGLRPEDKSHVSSVSA